jgi:hypothetical protein
MNRKLTSVLRRKASQRLVIAAMCVAAVALTVPYLGSGAQKRPLQPPQIALDNAQRIVSVTTADGPAVLYAAPASNGTQCVTISLPDLARGSDSIGARQNGGAMCSAGAMEPLTTAKLTTSMSWAPAGSAVALIITGRAAPSIRRIELLLGDGSTVPAALATGYYVSRLSVTKIGQLSGPVEVVSYDGAGREVAQLDLQAVLAASTPPSG